MTADDDEAAVSRALFSSWLRKVGLTREAWRSLAPAARAALVEVFFPLIDDAPLLTNPKRAKVRYVGQVQTTVQQRKVGRPIEFDHPFPVALREANVTVTEWAANHVDPETGRPYSRQRVKSWYTTSGGRAIPRHAAEVIEKEYPKVKATGRTWRNGIREA